MPRPGKGEVWMVDLGLVAKVRPCLLLTDWPANNELALISVVAHTTALRGNPWEHVVPTVKLERKLGELTSGEMRAIDSLLRTRLKLQAATS